MSEKPQPKITSLPSLFEKGRKAQDPTRDESETLFYTCPQCGHPMETKKCKIVCHQCRYFIGCSE